MKKNIMQSILRIKQRRSISLVSLSDARTERTLSDFLRLESRNTPLVIVPKIRLIRPIR